MRDMEFDFKKNIKELEGEIGDYKQKCERNVKDQEKLLKLIDDKDRLVQEHMKAEKQLKSQLKKADSESSKLGKKVSEYKKYINKIEEKILEKDEKLKYLEMFKKNSEICSQVESTVTGTPLGNFE